MADQKRMISYALSNKEREEVKNCLMNFIRQYCNNSSLLIPPEALATLPAITELLLNKF